MVDSKDIAPPLRYLRDSIDNIDAAMIQFVAPIEAFPDDRWDSIIAINLSAAFHAIKAAVPAMKARGYGRIVNIASAHGLVGSEGKAAYVAAKHGLVGLSKVVALDYANHGITCNAIALGGFLLPSSRSRSRTTPSRMASPSRRPSRASSRRSSRYGSSPRLSISAH